MTKSHKAILNNEKNALISRAYQKKEIAKVELLIERWLGGTRSIAKKHFDSSVMADKYIKLYKKIIAEYE